MMNNYRNLSEKEIATLLVYGCSADNWSEVSVHPEFSPAFISSVHFSGIVKLGKFEKIFSFPGGIKKHAGVFNAVLHNVSIGNDVYINSIHNHISNYIIDDDTFIENVNVIEVTGESTFGNGTNVSVMIESGDRNIRIFNGMPAPLAYLMTFYRHNQALIQAVNKSIEDNLSNQKSETGYIGKNCHIVNAGLLRNVIIRDEARIESVSRLINGSINSTPDAPVFVGHNVIAQDFIIESGTVVDSASIIQRCFIGQACSIEKGFSATDSVIFANSQFHHGEAVSVFAGPYTVSHHKSTLMLTALFSFMNAGSGTNFSNHMYKLGPLHQGITERGVKTSSGSYVMWPARIGAFSVVLGKHKNNADLSKMPFSYLMESDGESLLLPGINLQSAGTYRDVQKWPLRDGRKGKKIDPINFEMLNPYTVSKIKEGLKILLDLQEKINPDTGFVWFENCKIKRSALKKGIELYGAAIDKFIPDNIDLHASYGDISTEIGDEWADLAGMVLPENDLNILIENIIENQPDLSEIVNFFDTFLGKYNQNKTAYALKLAEEITGKDWKSWTQEDKNSLFNNWKTASLSFLKMIQKDAAKEFSTIAKTGFGIDGDMQTQHDDFNAVRGTYESHPFIIALKKEIEIIENKTVLS